MAATDDQQSNDGDASNSTVELEVTKTPLRMTLRSHSCQNPKDTASKSDTNKSRDAGTSAHIKPTDGAETEAVGDNVTSELSTSAFSSSLYSSEGVLRAKRAEALVCSMVGSTPLGNP